MDVAERLTPYATLFRYPSDVLEPEPGEFAQSLTNAEQFVPELARSETGQSGSAFILEIFPQTVHPI